jgi:uncharacterized membrane protein YfcA
MSILMLAGLAGLMTATAFLSGVFGMVGGLILMGVLIQLLPLPETMALHAITQMASNGWRGLLWWRQVRWGVAGVFLAGSAIAFVGWALLRYTPSKPFVLICMGLAPFLVHVVPAALKPSPGKLGSGLLYGAVSMTLLLLSGVSGPLIDTYFLGGSMDRRQIVATKAICQICGHGAKFVYFGGLVETVAVVDTTMAMLAVLASLLGVTLARPVLERLSDLQFRRWAGLMVATVSVFYLMQGLYMLTIG